MLLALLAAAVTLPGSLYLDGAASPAQLYQQEFSAFADAGVHLTRDVSVQLKGSVRQSVRAAGLDENSRAVEARWSPYPLPVYFEAGAGQVFARDHEEFDQDECVKYFAEGPTLGAGLTKEKTSRLRYGVSLFNVLFPRKERAEPCGEGSDYYKEYRHNAVVTNYLTFTLGLTY